jgi:hypothetical protein
MTSRIPAAEADAAPSCEPSSPLAHLTRPAGVQPRQYADAIMTRDRRLAPCPDTSKATNLRFSHNLSRDTSTPGLGTLAAGPETSTEKTSLR